MAAKLIWTVSALNDLEGIAAFIGQDSPHFATLTVEQIVSATERLVDFPRSGRVVPEYEDPDLREVLWREYRIVYRIQADQVAIAAVVHGARQLGEGGRP